MNTNMKYVTEIEIEQPMMMIHDFVFLFTDTLINQTIIT